MSERVDAWAELHAATPPGSWFVRRRLPVLVVAITAFLATGCETVSEFGPPVAGAGQRALIIPVENHSAQPAELVVAEAPTFGIGRSVGAAHPAAVPSGARVEVTFIVPNAPGWGIYGDPGGDRLLLLIASELERCTGQVPILIEIDRDGIWSWGGAMPPLCGQ
jgi:predicted small secreted protein